MIVSFKKYFTSPSWLKYLLPRHVQRNLWLKLVSSKDISSDILRIKMTQGNKYLLMVLYGIMVPMQETGFWSS